MVMHNSLRIIAPILESIHSSSLRSIGVKKGVKSPSEQKGLETVAELQQRGPACHARAAPSFAAGFSQTSTAES
jgi:hypothetical protein